MPDKYCTDTGHTTHTWTEPHVGQELRGRKDLGFIMSATDLSY